MRLDTMFGTRTDLVVRLIEFMDYAYDNDGQIVLYTGITEDDYCAWLDGFGVDDGETGETGMVSTELASECGG